MKPSTTSTFSARTHLLEQIQKLDPRSKYGPQVKDAQKYEMFESVIKNMGCPINLDDVDPSKLKFISDTHFGHNRIIEYCNRPFDDVDVMLSDIIKNYCSVVKEDDVVVWGGDVAFKSHTYINSILGALPGYKILIIGNHDFERRSNKIIKYDFDEIHLVAQVQNYYISHHPWWDVPEGCFHIHGHTHNTLIEGNQHVNICVENTNYTPISFAEILNRR